MTSATTLEDTRTPRTAYSESGTRAKLQQRVAAPDPSVLHVPCLKVVFQHNGRPRRVEWQCHGSVGFTGCPRDAGCQFADSSLHLTVQDSAARVTWVDLDGLSLVDRGARGDRRVEPYRITDVSTVHDGFVTTYSSVLAYRVSDDQGQTSRTNLTRVTASFVPGSSLHLFFLYRDVEGNPGRISVFADAGRDGAAALPTAC